MNLLDILIICTLVFLVVKGLLRGFVREIASLAGVILGIVLGSHFQPQVTEALRPYLPSTSFLPIISFGVIFTSTLVLCNLLGWAIKLLFKKAKIGWVDRTLGVCLAVIKGIIITYLVIVILTFFLPSSTPLIADSKLRQWVIVSYQSMAQLISPDHYQNWKKKFLDKQAEVTEKAPAKGKDHPEKSEQR
jgi:membrane protein required for colicin V production